ncbi:hypothetical protein X742_24810 [Mesorhizobium sp. LNHC232B00]|nr:hypothetical protein X742_24810 [Mesorhizobium sp. LNHC232B00]
MEQTKWPSFAFVIAEGEVGFDPPQRRWHGLASADALRVAAFAMMD